MGWCLPLAGPTMVQPVVFFISACLWDLASKIYLSSRHGCLGCCAFWGILLFLIHCMLLLPLCAEWCSCGDPESFVRGGPTLTTFFFCCCCWWGERYHYMRTIILWFFQGEGGPMHPTPLDPRMLYLVFLFCCVILSYLLTLVAKTNSQRKIVNIF